MDDFLDQFLDNKPIKDKPNVPWIFSNRINYHSPTNARAIQASGITMLKDTIIENTRKIAFSVSPRQNATWFELMGGAGIGFSHISVNDTKMNPNGETIIRYKSNRIFTYLLSNSEEDLLIELVFDKSEKPNLSLRGISFDLLEHEAFSIQSRSDDMMPFFAVLNDAIVVTQRVEL